jgi:hypothetical protein
MYVLTADKSSMERAIEEVRQTESTAPTILRNSSATRLPLGRNSITCGHRT